MISVYNLEQVGQCVAQMIIRLRKYMGTREPDVHLIGFSLGAHVAAYTARHLRPYKLPRITGKFEQFWAFWPVLHTVLFF